MKLDVQNECHRCTHKRTVPGNCHGQTPRGRSPKTIKCAKPDQHMTGNQHGINNGWFFYPSLFDPTWKTKKCVNYEEKT